MVVVLVLAVLGMVLLDLVWALSIGFTVDHILPQGVKIAAVALVGGVYLRLRPNPRLVEMLTYVLLWLVFSAAAAVMTYLAASGGAPFQDALFRRADHALHFDLRALGNTLHAYRLVWLTLEAIYFSLLVQISITVVWLAHTRAQGRNAAFLGAAILSFLASCLISALLPALGPSGAENPSMPGAHDYVAEILAMRSGAPVGRTLESLQGIICFPSYHTVLAVLITGAHRGLTTFWPVLAINAAMLLSVPPVGNHYLVDLLGGLVIAGAAMAAMAQLPTRRHSAL